MTDLSALVEDAARAIATAQIEAFKDPAIWAEDLPHYRKRDARFNGEPHLESPIGMARAALLAFHNPDSEAGKALVECVARGLATWARPNDTPMEIDRDCARAALTAIARALSEQRA